MKWSPMIVTYFGKNQTFRVSGRQNVVKNN